MLLARKTRAMKLCTSDARSEKDCLTNLRGTNSIQTNLTRPSQS